MADLYIGARVTGENFYFEEGRRFQYLDEKQLAVMAEFLTDMAELIQKQAKDGRGELVAEFFQNGLPGVPETMVVKGVSRDDMEQFQHRFSAGWLSTVNRFSKGRAKKQK